MIFNTLLAHGTLGNWDEFIFASVTVIFVGFMILSWARSRAVAPDLPDEKRKNDDLSDDLEHPSQSDHFQLD